MREKCREDEKERDQSAGEKIKKKTPVSHEELVTLRG